MKLLCPACGAEIQFKSRVSVFGVCTYCASMVVRRDVDVESLGKMATLPEDMSPLQIGVRGQYEKKTFELVGRLKIAWSDGDWNEWYALFDDGRDGWLAEAQGQYMVSFQIREGAKIPDRKLIAPGEEFALVKENQFFEVTDIKEATCVGSAGELPMRGEKGRKSLSVDLTGENGAFATLDYSSEEPRLYVGKYLDFDQFKFVGLREIDGW